MKEFAIFYRLYTKKREYITSRKWKKVDKFIEKQLDFIEENDEELKSRLGLTEDQVGYYIDILNKQLKVISNRKKKLFSTVVDYEKLEKVVASKEVPSISIWVDLNTKDERKRKRKAKAVLTVIAAGAIAAAGGCATVKNADFLNNNTRVEQTEQVRQINQSYKQSREYREDVKYMALLLYGEADTCNDIEKNCIADVVINRVLSDDYPDSIQEVVEQRRYSKSRGRHVYQFSCFGEPNLTNILRAERKGYKTYNACKVIAEGIVQSLYEGTYRPKFKGCFYRTIDSYERVASKRNKTSDDLWWINLMNHGYVKDGFKHIFSNVNPEFDKLSPADAHARYINKLKNFRANVRY